MENETQKKFSLYRTLGSQLIDKGKWFLNQATPMHQTIYTQLKMSGAIQSIVGNYPLLNDEKYFTTNIETWKTIIENDWTNKKKYVSDIFDCDNYSNSFCSYCAEIYGLNTAGRFTCELINPETKKHIGYHRAVIIIDDKLDCYLLESQDDRMVKIEKGVLPVIGTWGYKVTIMELN